MASDNKFTPAGPVAGKFGQLGPLTDNRFDRPSGNPANPDQPIPVFPDPNPIIPPSQLDKVFGVQPDKIFGIGNKVFGVRK